MSLIIENGKVIKATGDANQIIADFNEYLEFVRETTIPVPKDQFTNLSENHAKLYNDHMEAIKANKDLQEEIKNLKHAHTLNILENNKEASTIIAKRAAEIDKLKEENEKLKKKVSLYECIEEVRKCIKETSDAEMRHQYDDDLYRLLNALSSIDEEDAKDQQLSKDVNSAIDTIKGSTKKDTKIASIEDTEAKRKWEEEQEEIEKLGAEIYAENQKAAKNRHSSWLSDNDTVETDKKLEDKDPNDNSDSYKNGDLAFIIHRSWAGPTDSEIIVHVTLAMYTGFLWHSLSMQLIETDFADIIPIKDADYLKEYFDKEDPSWGVKFHY